MVTFTDLPPEIILTILDNLQPPQPPIPRRNRYLSDISLTCKTLYNLSRPLIWKRLDIVFQDPEDIPQQVSRCRYILSNPDLVGRFVREILVFQTSESSSGSYGVESTGDRDGKSTTEFISVLSDLLKQSCPHLSTFKFCLPGTSAEDLRTLEDAIKHKRLNHLTLRGDFRLSSPSFQTWFSTSPLKSVSLDIPDFLPSLATISHSQTISELHLVEPRTLTSRDTTESGITHPIDPRFWDQLRKLRLRISTRSTCTTLIQSLNPSRQSRHPSFGSSHTLKELDLDLGPDIKLSQTLVQETIDALPPSDKLERLVIPSWLGISNGTDLIRSYPSVEVLFVRWRRSDPLDMIQLAHQISSFQSLHTIEIVPGCGDISFLNSHYQIPWVSELLESDRWYILSKYARTRGYLRLAKVVCPKLGWIRDNRYADTAWRVVRGSDTGTVEMVPERMDVAAPGHLCV